MNGPFGTPSRVGTRRVRRVCVALLAAAAAVLVGVVPAAATATGTIAGTITGPGGPVAGAHVDAWPVGGGSVTSAITTLAGVYAMDLAPGDYVVEFDGTSLGLGVDYYDHAATEAAATPVHVIANAHVPGINGYLSLGASISGTVTGPGGPANDVWVRAYPTSGADDSYTATASDGTYQITGLAPGTYRVEFDGRDQYLSAGYYDGAATWDEATLVTVVDLVDTPDIDAVLSATGMIAGTVSGLGGPIEGVSVSVQGTDGYGNAAYTGADGTYVITGIPTGTYKVWFQGEDTGYVSEYYDDEVHWADATPVAVTAGATTSGVNALLALGGSISGTVTGPGGPVAGVWVGAHGAAYYDGTLTAADGTYMIMGLPAGSFTVDFTASSVGLVSEWYADVLLQASATPVAVAAGAQTPGINAALVAGGSIAGTVTGPGGPVADVYVRAEDAAGGGRGSAWTDAGGHYLVDGLAPGQYKVSFEPMGETLHSEYYNDQPGPLTANPVSLTGVADVTGIDAVLSPTSTPLFLDVPFGAPFYAEIDWLVFAGISTGYADGSFHPSAAVSRQAMAAFLYRLAGEPAFAPPSTPSFTDVPARSPFYREVEWLASTGIAAGYADGSFHPSAAVSRQAMAAFLYRLAGEPAFAPPSTPSFTDVPARSSFYREVEWLASTGIATGWRDGTFRPVAEVTRQAMAAFLMRYDLAFGD